MISWHKVGQKVVCKVDAEWGMDLVEILFRQGFTHQPVLGAIYTITKVVMDEGQIGFDFDELPCEGFSLGWLADAFDPVYPQAVDKLRELLNPTPEQKRPVLEEIITERVVGLLT